MIIRLGMPLFVTGAQLGAAALALGRPDPGPALAFLGGGLPTAAETLAALELLVWAIVVAALAWSLGAMAWGLAHHAAGSRGFREGSVLLTGLLILVAGVAHHVTQSTGMSGGTVREAQSFLGH